MTLLPMSAYYTLPNQPVLSMIVYSDILESCFLVIEESGDVSEKILEGREMEFYRWEGDPQEILKGVRKNLNMLGEHWPRDEKHKCLKEASKSFKFLGQIVRLIIL
ncbi:hypothetical protein Pint_08836 [Pistacia integerrima]|uniref:Uncharacterized protein n=1 Tax=Pistacia integerrima TaxID=434235 RepID=A0ACC0XUE4_9ROSI|nr:hypothetical protein Pint_08836 [Pistacia integerrima]